MTEEKTGAGAQLNISDRRGGWAQGNFFVLRKSQNFVFGANFIFEGLFPVWSILCISHTHLKSLFWGQHFLFKSNFKINKRGICFKLRVFVMGKIS